MNKTTNWQKVLITIISIIGIITTLKLTFIYYNANFAQNASPSFCSLNSHIDCDGVARTPYSHFLGIPTSIYGLSFYLLVLFLNFVPQLKDKSLFNIVEFNIFKNPYSYIFTFAAISLIVSIILAVISSFVINKICILCYFTYILNFALLLISKSNIKSKEHLKNTFIDFKEAINIKKYAILTTILSITILITISLTTYYGWFVPSQASDLFGVKQFSYVSNKVIGNTLGDKNAKVIIHEYTDYQCPYCGISNAMLNQLVVQVKGVKVIHHDYPLDKACNQNMKSEGHKGSCLYARYGLAAQLQGKHWDFNNAIFPKNQNLTEAKILQYAKNAGLNIEQLKKDAYSPKIKQDVVKEIKSANSYGITATPTYRIGIKKYEGLIPYEELIGIVISEGATFRR